MIRWTNLLILTVISFAGLTARLPAQVLDHQKLLDAQTFWDNRDWDWYKANIPFFECPDADITKTYYYRWELITKHLTYGSPNSGYSFTEFIDRPFWSGAYGAISCPAGHQLYEVRWLRDFRYARDYARYWFHTPGAQPRNYSTWLADAVWATHLVQPDPEFVRQLLPGMIKNYEGWEERHFVPEVGLFWQTGHDDGMEYNINSRQSQDIVRGAPGFRPTLNAYMWADALAIARVAESSGDKKKAQEFRDKAGRLKNNLQKKLWDPQRNFFFHMYKQDEEHEGHKLKALSLTNQTGRFAGDTHGRELIGYVPWQFNLPDAGYEAAWKPLMDRDGFFSEFGPMTVERHDPLFKISKTCCWWSGNSWPYATAQTLKAMANLLQNYRQDVVSKQDYLKLLHTFAKTHRKDGKPYIAEACHPETGSWEGHDGTNHSEHYFHSNFCDLVITGLVGLSPRDDDTFELKPLAPAKWDYFALDNLLYRGRPITVIWDRTGTRYGHGQGLHVLNGNQVIASSRELKPITAKLSRTFRLQPPSLRQMPVNFAVNNDADYFPRAIASHSGPHSNVALLNDGNYWYHRSPSNRWTCEGSPNKSDWCGIDFGTPRPSHEVKLFILDDGDVIATPTKINLEFWDSKTWQPIPNQKRVPPEPTGHRANVISFPEMSVSKLRSVLTHREGKKSGLSEFEAWGNADLPLQPAPIPAGNLAYNATGKGFPKATASHTDRFGGNPMAAIDGKVSFRPSPMNRWTSYESSNAQDWLEIDFGEMKQIGRVELGIYDDHGGVQAPTRYDIEQWTGTGWADVVITKRTPGNPAGGQFNEATFSQVKTGKIRIVFTNNGRAKSGVTEVMAWSE